MYEYRVIKSADGWFEPQMRANTGHGDMVWAPLNAKGYWVDPEVFNSERGEDTVGERHLFKAEAQANHAIWLAKTMNTETNI